MQCPLAAAIKVTSTGKIRIGWTVARAELLKARPTQCYKCWEFGHISYTCKNKVDRRGCCFNCGIAGYTVQACSETPCCMVCKSVGQPDGHRIGGPLCNSSNMSGRIPFRRTENELMEYDSYII